MHRLNEKLLAAAQKVKQAEKIRSDLAQVEDTLAREKARFKQLQRQVHKEGKDVKKLEGLSISSLFYTILGSKEEQLDKERQEYLAAKLRFDQCQEVIDSLEQDRHNLREKLEILADCETEYQYLLQEKERLLLAENSYASQKLCQLTEQLAALSGKQRELVEAINAGRAVVQLLDEAHNSLQSASNWGVWDMLGGGLISTAVKHSKIDDAKNAVYRVQNAMHSFMRELKDVGSAINQVNIDIGSFATFADYFFDGLIADWVVQSRIKNSLNQVFSAQKSVHNVLLVLQQQLQITDSELERKQQEYQDFLAKI